jgi:hypothetical protein
LVIDLLVEWIGEEVSVDETWLEQCTGNPGAEHNDGEGGDHRILGTRSLGRLSTKVTMPVRTTTRATTIVMAAV